MDKLKMHSKDKTQENFEILQKLFPNAVTETIVDGEVVRAIDKDVLQQEINATVVDGREERYQFTWPDKKRAIISANAPINKTLRPCREESVDFDNTENLYIEGDNLEVLKLLQETYLGKIKMIYIDPPYNTGHDFVYNDKFSVSPEEWDEMSGELDEYGNRLVQNNESNGRFHTDWLNMIYPRLKIARDLLTDDGVIFISIDDNEVTNLTKICDEIFGAHNRIALICHKSRASISNDKVISPNHNTILFYSKNRIDIEIKRKSIGLKPVLDGFDLDENDGKGPYRLVPVDGPGGAKKGNPYYEFLGVKGYWRFSEETMRNKYNHGEVVKKGNGLYQKYYRNAAEKTRRTITTWWDDAGLISNATTRLNSLMGEKVFDTPKPVELICRMIEMMTSDNENSIILDFFSGSSTTAHAVMRQNFQDVFDGKKGKRKFIMVQLPEKTDEKSEAYKAGYKNICEIGKERIRRAGKTEYLSVVGTMGSSRRWNEKRKTELGDDYFSPSNVDIGFRVLKLDSSNMKDVYYNPADFQKSLLDTTVDNIKEDRTPEDLLFQVMLDLGVLLSEKIEESEIAGKKVFNVANGYLIACFDSDVNEETITAVAKQKPIYFVMRDSSMATDTTATNFDQIFETYSPDTVRKVI